jgi:hypothetical protein
LLEANVALVLVELDELVEPHAVVSPATAPTKTTVTNDCLNRPI